MNWIRSYRFSLWFRFVTFPDVVPYVKLKKHVILQDKLHCRSLSSLQKYGFLAGWLSKVTVCPQGTSLGLLIVILVYIMVLDASGIYVATKHYYTILTDAQSLTATIFTCRNMRINNARDQLSTCPTAAPIRPENRSVSMCVTHAVQRSRRNNSPSPKARRSRCRTMLMAPNVFCVAIFFCFNWILNCFTLNFIPFCGP